MKIIIHSKKILEKSLLENLFLKQVSGNSHYVFIQPKDKTYKVEEIRTFTSRLHNRPTDLTENLFYILLYGDELSIICQNALLKTLEESAYSIGILVKNTDSLLPTIRSRCQLMMLLTDGHIDDNSDSLRVELDFVKLYKSERNDAIIKLEVYIDSLKPEEILLTLPIQNAINKLNSNCKVEAVIIELENNLKA